MRHALLLDGYDDRAADALQHVQPLAIGPDVIAVVRSTFSRLPQQLGPKGGGWTFVDDFIRIYIMPPAQLAALAYVSLQEASKSARQGYVAGYGNFLRICFVSIHLASATSSAYEALQPGTVLAYGNEKQALTIP